MPRPGARDLDPAWAVMLAVMLVCVSQNLMLTADSYTPTLNARVIPRGTKVLHGLAEVLRERHTTGEMHFPLLVFTLSCSPRRPYARARTKVVSFKTCHT